MKSRSFIGREVTKLFQHFTEKLDNCEYTNFKIQVYEKKVHQPAKRLVKAKSSSQTLFTSNVVEWKLRWLGKMRRPTASEKFKLIPPRLVISIKIKTWAGETALLSRFILYSKRIHGLEWMYINVIEFNVYIHKYKEKQRSFWYTCSNRRMKIPAMSLAVDRKMFWKKYLPRKFFYPLGLTYSHENFFSEDTTGQWTVLSRYDWRTRKTSFECVLDQNWTSDSILGKLRLYLFTASSLVEIEFNGKLASIFFIRMQYDIKNKTAASLC